MQNDLPHDRPHADPIHEDPIHAAPGHEDPPHENGTLEDITWSAPVPGYSPAEGRRLYRLGGPDSLGAADPVPLEAELPGDTSCDDPPFDEGCLDEGWPGEGWPDEDGFGRDADVDQEPGDAGIGDRPLADMTGRATAESPRRELFARVQAEAFSRADPFEGLLLSACAETAELAGLVQGLTVRALEESPGRVEDLDAVLPAIRTASKIYSQLQQFTLQQQRLSAARQAADPLLHRSASRDDRWSPGPAWHPGAPRPAADPGNAAPR